VEKLEATVASLAATVKEQATLIQKVSAQVQLNGVPPIAANPQSVVAASLCEMRASPQGDGYIVSVETKRN
jgi:hypothetical protein